MTDDKVNEVLAAIVEKLAPYMARRLDELDLPYPSRALALGHCKWMAQEALRWSPERLEKKFRWLGFIQGVLWAEGVNTIRELKEENKP